MEGFKKLPKGVQCFKVGGTVKYKSRHSEKSEMSEDIAQDKKIVKKAFSMHDKQSHEGKKTDLTKLNKGGRAKKAVGTVKKFEKASGEYGAKKTSTDINNIKQAKQFTPAVASTPSASIDKLNSIPMEFKKGGKIKKFNGASGSYTGMTGPAAAGQPANAPSATKKKLAELEERRSMEKMKRALTLDPAQQGELVTQDPRAAGLKTGVGNISMGNIGYKKGGKIKKYSGEDGSYVEPMPAPRQNFASRKPTNLAELQAEAAAKQNFASRKPSNLMEALSSEDARPVPRKPMMKKGGKAKKMNTGGTCS